MRVLVTGAEGWIGRHVVRELESRGHDVVSYDLVNGDDIHDRPRLARKMADKRGKCDAVAHLAAIPHPQFRYSWDDYWQANVVGTKTVADVADQYDADRFVYASSTAFYGAHEQFPWDRDDLKVGSRNAVDRYYGATLPRMDGSTRPSLDYALSKVAAETVLAAYGMGARMPVSVLRFRPCPPSRGTYQGLYVSPETCAVAVADALENDTDWYVVHDVEEPDVSD